MPLDMLVLRISWAEEGSADMEGDWVLMLLESFDDDDDDAIPLDLEDLLPSSRPWTLSILPLIKNKANRKQ